MEKTETKYRDIGDAYLLSYLLTIGFKSTQRHIVRNTVVLQFVDDEKLEEAVFNFYNGKGMVDALQVLNSYRAVNSMIRDVAREVK